MDQAEIIDMTGERRSKIIVVEDEPLIRMIVVDEFQEAGLDVIEASDAERALAIIERDPSVSIVFTDIDMPGSMNGIDLAATVRDRWPPVTIVVTSGKPTSRLSDIPPDTLFVPKPYDCLKLSQHFRALLS